MDCMYYEVFSPFATLPSHSLSLVDNEHKSCFHSSLPKNFKSLFSLVNKLRQRPNVAFSNSKSCHQYSMSLLNIPLFFLAIP
mmetsp:Transcript_14416/g.28833  ORF Transcript_14416/g.28833 Transcript_14416/m.28833 type:complete len:82 (-) Transcript_14416:647-892(-)